jgi:hypothetical protein
MRTLLLTSLLIACGAPAAPPVQTPTPIASAAPVDAPEEPVGAVPIPVEIVEYSTVHRDLTVTLAELPPPEATWRERATIRYTGRVAIALHIARHEFLEFTVVDTVTETQSGYPGTLESFRLGGADTHEQPMSGNAMPARDIDRTTGEYRGPMMFAVRLLPREGAAEAERRQYAVYARDRTIFVAEKLVTERAWTARLRIDAPSATELVAMHPGWH